MILGTNGQNFCEVMTEQDKIWIKESLLDGQRFGLRFRADGDEVNYISKLIDLHNYLLQNNRGLDVIYCIDVKGDPNLAFTNFTQVMNAGVNVVVVEFGNETYSKEQANFVFDTYRQWFEPVYNLIRAAYPTMEYSVFLAPRPKESGVLGGRQDHSNFNNAAITYINSHPDMHPSIHIYMNGQECPILATKPTQRVYSPTTVYPDLDSFYTTLYDQSFANFPGLWDHTLDYIGTKLPNKNLYITEWGYDNYGEIKNTLGVGAFAWDIWTTYGSDTRITALLQHNGISKAAPGFIFPKHPTNDTPDSTGNTNKRRVDYWIYKLYREIQNKQINESGIILEAGTFYIPFNITESNIITIGQGLQMVSSETRVIGGENLYTSSGVTEWMSKNSTPSYTIDGITTMKTKSLGYVKVVVDIVLPINEKPVAQITGPSSVVEGSQVTLDASTSFDEDGNIVEYKWYNSTTLVSQSKVYTFTAPAPGTYSYLLIVTDNKGETGTDTLTLTVNKKIIIKKPWYCSMFPWLKACKV